MPASLRPAAAVLLVLPVLAACPAGDRDDRSEARMDTANASWQDGLSAREVEANARALSPEEAEAQGMALDTTIHLEVGPEDTLPAPVVDGPTPPPVDTAAGRP